MNYWHLSLSNLWITTMVYNRFGVDLKTSARDACPPFCICISTTSVSIDAIAASIVFSHVL
jgi:hypothetical protein